jgi:hypothetical protein
VIFPIKQLTTLGIELFYFERTKSIGYITLSKKVIFPIKELTTRGIELFHFERTKSMWYITLS